MPQRHAQTFASHRDLIRCSAHALNTQTRWTSYRQVKSFSRCLAVCAMLHRAPEHSCQPLLHRSSCCYRCQQSDSVQLHATQRESDDLYAGDEYLLATVCAWCLAICHSLNRVETVESQLPSSPASSVDTSTSHRTGDIRTTGHPCGASRRSQHQ